MYASKTPRDLNHDPASMADPFSGVRFSGADELLGYEYDPRPKFDHVQHNEPNPILVAFRRDADEMKRERGWTVARTALSWDRDAFDPFVDMYDLAVLDHARRVLERLASLAQIEEEPEPTSDEEREYDEYLDQQFWGDH